MTQPSSDATVSAFDYRALEARLEAICAANNHAAEIRFQEVKRLTTELAKLRRELVELARAAQDEPAEKLRALILLASSKVLGNVRPAAELSQPSVEGAVLQAIRGVVQ